MRYSLVILQGVEDVQDALVLDLALVQLNLLEPLAGLGLNQEVGEVRDHLVAQDIV